MEEPREVEKAATWPEEKLSSEQITGCSVVGLSNAHPVSGVNGARHPEDDCVVFYNTISEGGNSGTLLYRSDAVTVTPCFMHLAGDGNAVKRGYAIELPIAAALTAQFKPMAVGAGHSLTWIVRSTESLRLKLNGEEPKDKDETLTVTAQVLRHELPGCAHGNIVKLSRDYSCGRGEVLGVLLDVPTLYRPHRSTLEEIQKGWVGPADVVKSEARELLQELFATNRVDCQIAALDGLSRIGPAVGSTGVHLVCHVINQERSGGVDAATAVRALEVLPQLVTGGCADSGSREVALETARNACSRGSWVQAAAAAAIHKISGAISDRNVRASCLKPLDANNADDASRSGGKKGHLDAARPPAASETQYMGPQRPLPLHGTRSLERIAHGAH
jgi:hypothetical protein